MPENLFRSQIKFEVLPAVNNGELSEKVYRKCLFCEKSCQTGDAQTAICERLSGPENFYCAFCLRHGFHTKANRDVLILSFRSIIGYFYQQNYLQYPRKLWISEIEDYIELHRSAGLVNPLFVYDPDSMLWFVDFSRVGNTKKKINLDEVLKTVLSILATFNLWDTTPGISLNSFYAKYKDAIDSFYRKRYRPESRRMLIPTLANTGMDSKSCNFEKMRNFSSENLRIRRTRID